MKHPIYSIATATFIAATAQQAAATSPPPVYPTASELAASDQLAFQIVDQLTGDVGQRLAGTDAEQRGRDWAIKKLNELGFANVREESFMMPTWVRGYDDVQIMSPVMLRLKATSIGNSSSGQVTGDIVYFKTFDDLVLAPDERVKGKIVFVDHQMKRTQDGSSYGYFGRARFQGPNVAAKKGATAIVIRSASTGDHDHPHTGNTNFDAGTKAIPAMALSNKSADKLVEIYNASPYKKDAFIKNFTLMVSSGSKNIGLQKSGNVVAEVVGSNPALAPILIACHLDSWDLATGAIDDASGCGIITAAAHYVRNARTASPKRTIRILWAGAEEVGVWGGKAYGEKYGSEPHALAMESDFGADRVWAVDFNLPDSAKPLQESISRRLALLGIVPRKQKAGGGADIGPIIAKQGLGVIDLQQDGTRYFDIHHNATDTIERIDKDQLRQNVIAWTTVLDEVANYEGELKPEAVKP
jgi:carboxypeptidase Q